MASRDGRRTFLTVAGAGALLAACKDGTSAAPPGRGQDLKDVLGQASPQKPVEQAEKPEEVGAVEDLMREHGVIRRVLVVYRESARRLRTDPISVPPDALQRAAKLMRTFGEDYHERQLEEAHIFPAVKQAGGPAAGEIDTLTLQHQRGREITDYVLAVTANVIARANIDPLGKTLDAFALMYEEHAAREDTIVFTAWKKTMSPKQLDEAGDLFEDIEKKTFGKDGFDDAVAQVEAIEKEMGFDWRGLTAPPPPKG